MDVNNGTKTPTDTRVTSGSSGFYQRPGPGETRKASPAWRTIQPGETASFDLEGKGPWKVEVRVMKDGRRRTISATVRTPEDLVKLIENGGEVQLNVIPTRAA